MLSNSNPNIPPEKLQELKQKYSIDEYINRLLPIISSQFTKDELKDLISFYNGDLGKKMVNVEFADKIKKVGDDLFSEMNNIFSINDKE